jgi:hypothetical protein
MLAVARRMVAMPTVAEVKELGTRIAKTRGSALVNDAFNVLRIMISAELGQPIDTLPEGTELGPRGEGALKGFKVYARHLEEQGREMLAD